MTFKLYKYHKLYTIRNWKRSGLIYDDYEELYEIYIKTMKCGHCNKEFKQSRDRQLDHDHETGMFRKIVCNRCNSKDTYINSPDVLEYKDRRNLRVKCICGVETTNSGMWQHKQTQKHLNSMDKYMNNVD